jgi:3-deoxy-D-manno-octulosonate 8-phosphate phosphatase (KDO 8-P phosphatase)
LSNHKTIKVCPKVFILDVDGVMTTGDFFYTEGGKVMKVFGPDDNDALSLIKENLEVRFVTGDRKGFSISKKRIVDDMGHKLDLVSTINRIDWIRERYNLSEVVYMGDGIFDHYVMREVIYSIAPNNADENAKSFSNFVTKRRGGDRAVSEAALHLLEKFFVPYDPSILPKTTGKLSGEWAV